MTRIASLLAALLSASIYLVASPSAACETGGNAVKASSVLDRVDRVLAGTCLCDGKLDAASAKKSGCSCTRTERRILEKIEGARNSPELPRNARFDASAGVFI